MSSLGLDGLQKINFQHDNLWIFYILDTGDVSTTTLVNGDLFKAARTATDPLSLGQLCQSVSLPWYKVQTTNHPATNRKYYSDSDTLEPVNIEFMETEGNFVNQYFQQWQSDVYDPDDKVFKTGNHKRTGFLLVFGASSLFSGIEASFVSGANNAFGALNKALGFKQAEKLKTIGVGEVADTIMNWIPTGVYQYEGLAYEGMSAYNFQYASASLRRTTASLTVDRIRRTDWTPKLIDDYAKSIRNNTTAGAWNPFG